MNNKQWRPQRIAAPKMQCFKCTGEGHMKRECPSLTKVQKFDRKKNDKEKGGQVTKIEHIETSTKINMEDSSRGTKHF